MIPRPTPIVAAWLVLAACDGLLFPDRPEDIRVLLEGDASEPVRVVTSRDFIVGGSGEASRSGVEFVEADTALVALPFERTYPMAPTYHFAVRVSVADTAADVRMRVVLDGREVWDERTSSGTGDLEFYVIRH